MLLHLRYCDCEKSSCSQCMEKRLSKRLHARLVKLKTLLLYKVYHLKKDNCTLYIVRSIFHRQKTPKYIPN